MNSLDMSKTKFTQLLQVKGYDTIADFARDCDVTPQTIFVHVRDQYKPDIKRMFLYADVLEVPIDSILEIFYSEELSHNEAICNEVESIKGN